MNDFLNFINIIHEAKTNLIGNVGELVFSEFSDKFLNDQYHIMNNVVLKAQNGTTQIDQIIVSKFGVFVIEIKNYKGWIFGNEHQPQWTQTLTSGKYRFQNPLRQNYKHIKALQELLNYPESFFISLVVFSGQVEFKTQLPGNVVNGGIDYINFIKNHQSILLSDEQIKTVLQKIESYRLTNQEHQNHIKKIKEQYNNPNENNQPQCPRCSNKMVLRTAKSGNNAGSQFWGCSRYPYCKAIVNIKEKIDYEVINKLLKDILF
ncbi:MAG: hypothetical protein RL637_530 [Pseudomonadota bacterium]